MVTASDKRSKGRRFDSKPFHRQVTTLGKLFTHMLQAVYIWYRPKSREGNDSVGEVWPTTHIS